GRRRRGTSPRRGAGGLMSSRHRSARVGGSRWPVLAVVVVTVLLSACGGQDPGDTPAPTPDTPTQEPTSIELPPSPGPSSPAPSPTGQEVDAAIADLAEHLDVAPAQIHVVSYQEVTWPDGSIGCPQPGMSYTQALVPGT